MADYAVSFWRQMDWRLWSHAYINETPETERIAWVRRRGHIAKSGQAVNSVEHDRFPAQVRDISLGGLVLVVNERFESGTLLRVEVNGPEGNAPVALLARVIHLAAQSQRTFVLSCCYAKELSDEDLRVFGAGCVRPERDDGRAWQRFACDTDTEFHCVVAAEHEKLRAKIRNISAGGFAMLVNHQFEPNTLIQLQMFDAGGQPAQTIMARVVHAGAQPDGAWLLGCTFVTELSDSELEVLM